MIYKFIETQRFKGGQNIFGKKKDKIGRFALIDIKGFLFVLIARIQVMRDCSGIEKPIKTIK